MSTLTLDVITPSRVALHTKCEDVYIPDADGEMGILSSHENYVTLMGTGLVRIHGGEDAQVLCVRGGFIEVSADSVSLLADEVKFQSEVNATDLQDQMLKVDTKLGSMESDILLQEALLEEKKWLQVQTDFVSK